MQPRRTIFPAPLLLCAAFIGLSCIPPEDSLTLGTGGTPGPNGDAATGIGDAAPGTGGGPTGTGGRPTGTGGGPAGTGGATGGTSTGGKVGPGATDAGTGGDASGSGGRGQGGNATAGIGGGGGSRTGGTIGSGGRGTGNTGGAGGGGGATPAFANVVAIIKSECTPCHSLARAPNLDTLSLTRLYSTLTSTSVSQCGNNRLVTPNDTTKSALLMMITGKCGTFRMPRGCLTSMCLMASDQATITAWIQAGAKNP